MSLNTQSIPMPLTALVDGRVWGLFAVEYTTADGVFSTYVYALSSEHASYIVDEMRSTAKLVGQVAGWMPAA